MTGMGARRQSRCGAHEWTLNEQHVAMKESILRPTGGGTRPDRFHFNNNNNNNYFINNNNFSTIFISQS